MYIYICILKKNFICKTIWDYDNNKITLYRKNKSQKDQ